MSMPFYASAEQIMRDRSEFARKGIARGRSVVVLAYTDGVLFVAENASTALHKVSEIYDRIGFAAVGKYNEFENLRVAGIRLADLRGYAYDRRDVTARALANAYAQTLGIDLHRAAEALRGRDLRRRGRRQRRRRPDLPALLRRHDRRRARLPGHGRAGRIADERGPRELPARPRPGRRARRRGRAPSDRAAPTAPRARCRPASSKSPSSTAPGRTASSSG